MISDIIYRIATTYIVVISMSVLILFALSNLKDKRNFRLKKFKPKQTKIRLFR